MDGQVDGQMGCLVFHCHEFMPCDTAQVHLRRVDWFPREQGFVHYKYLWTPGSQISGSENALH